MTIDLKGQVRELGSTIESRKAVAAEKWAAFDGLRKSAVAEGVDFATNTEAFDRLDTAGKEYDLERAAIADLEQKRARLAELAADGKAFDREDREDRGDRRPATFGKAFVDSEIFRASKARIEQGSNVPLGTTDGVKVMDREEAKTLLSVTGTGLGGRAIQEDRLGLIVAKPLQTLDLLSIIDSGTTDSDVVEWLEETTYTNSAAETAETSAAPESALAFTLRTANVKEIPHFIPVTRRSMADAAFIESWINSRLVDGVRRRLQTQILSGGGTGEDLTGIYNTAGIGSIDRSVTSLAMAESLHRCITTIRTNAFVEPDFIGIHPTDYEAIRIIRSDAITAADAKGVYLIGSPTEGGYGNLWGVPLIVHAGFTSGSPLVGRGADATLWIREGVTVSASDSHSTYFTERKVALLATLRAAFGVTQPKAFAVSVA